MIEGTKESYDIGSEENKVDYNIWLPEAILPGFREYETELFWQLHEVSARILDALLMGLEIDEGAAESFKYIHDGHNTQMRLYQYPQINREDIDIKFQIRLPPHTDFE